MSSPPPAIGDEAEKIPATKAASTTSPSSTFAGSSANSLPISDVTSDDREDTTKIPFAYARRQPTQTPCPPRYPPRPSSPPQRPISEVKRPRSVRALLVPRSLLDDPDPPRRPLPRDHSFESEDASSAWFATSSSSPSLRYSAKSLASDSADSINQPSSANIEAFHNVSSPALTPSASLRRIAAAAVATADSRTSARRKSRREKARDPSTSTASSGPDIPRSRSPLFRISHSKSAGPISHPAPAAATASQSSVPTHRPGIIFAPRRNIGFRDWEELEEDSRRDLHIPRGLVETLPESRPTRLPRTRVFIQKSSNLSAKGQPSGGHLPLSAENSSKEHLGDSRISSVTNNSSNFDSIAEPRSASGDSEATIADERQQRVSSVTVASESDDTGAEADAASSSLVGDEGEKQSEDIFNDDASSRFLSFSKADFRRQIRSAVDAFRSTSAPGDEQEAEGIAPRNASSEKLNRSRRSLRLSLASPVDLPRPLAAMSDLDGEESDRQTEDEDDIVVPTLQKTSSTRFPDRPRFNRRLGMMGSGRIVSGSSSKKGSKFSDAEDGGQLGIGQLGKVARRLFRTGLSFGKERKSSATLDEKGAAAEPESDTTGKTLVMREETKSRSAVTSVSGEAEAQNSDVYVAFVRDAAEREARLHLKDVCLPKKMIARASLKMKGRRPAPTLPFVGGERRGTVETVLLQ